jgi:hypothetical protein
VAGLGCGKGSSSTENIDSQQPKMVQAVSKESFVPKASLEGSPSAQTISAARVEMKRIDAAPVPSNVPVNQPASPVTPSAVQATPSLLSQQDKPTPGTTDVVHSQTLSGNSVSISSGSQQILSTTGSPAMAPVTTNVQSMTTVNQNNVSVDPKGQTDAIAGNSIQASGSTSGTTVSPAAQGGVVAIQGGVTGDSKGQAEAVGSPVPVRDKDNSADVARHPVPERDPSNPRRGAVPPRSSTGSDDDHAVATKGDSTPPAVKPHKGGGDVPPVKGTPPAGTEGTGLAFNQPGGVVSSPPTYTILTPMLNLAQMSVRFSNETDEVSSVQVAIKGFGAEANKFPGGTILEKSLLTKKISPCEGDCQAELMRVIYFDQWKNAPFLTQGEASDFIHNQLISDPSSLWTLAGGSAQYWDLPIKSAKVSFDSIPLQSGGIYLFFFKPTGSSNETAKGNFTNMEDFKKAILETNGLLRALQLMSSGGDPEAS